MTTVATTFDGAVITADGGGLVPAGAFYDGGIARRSDGAMYVVPPNTTTMSTTNSAAANATALQADMDRVGGVFTVTGTAWAATNSNTIITVTLANHGGVTGDTVYINGVTGGPYNNIPATAIGSLGLGGGLNGGHTITVTGPNTFTFVSTSIASATGPITPTGTITITMGNRGGVVYIPAGTYNLAADVLTYRSGVIVEGVIPKLTSNTNQPDLVFAMSGGTILNGPGTGTMISYSGVDTGATTFAQTNLSSCGFRKLGIKNFANFSVTGGTTLAGVSWHYLEDLYFTDISGTAIKSINSQHMIYNRIFGYIPGNGLDIQDDIPKATYGTVTGTKLDDIYFNTSSFTSCAFSFYAAATSDVGNLNEITANRLMAEAFGTLRTNGLTQPISWANATANITVAANIENLPVDMPVMFSAAVGTVVNTTGVYFVVSNSGGTGAGTITVSTRLRGTALVSDAGSTQTPNVLSNGMSQCRFFGATSGMFHTNYTFLSLDLEGPSTAALILQDMQKCTIKATVLGNTTVSPRGVVARNVTYTDLVSYEDAKFDCDTTSTGDNGLRRYGRFGGDDIGTTGAVRRANGIAYDALNSINTWRFSNASALNVGTAGVVRATGSSISQPLFPRAGTLTLANTQSGNVVMTGSGVATLFTLPTIVNSSLAASNVGVEYRFVNTGNGTAANNYLIQSGNLELFNKVTGRTSINLPVGAAVTLTAVADAVVGSNGNLYWMVSNYTLPPTSAFPTVAQLTSKSTAVTLDQRCARITMNAASLGAATSVNFAWNSTLIKADDEVSAWVGSGAASMPGGPSYSVQVLDVAAGVVWLRVTNITAGALLEAIVINAACTNW